MSISLKTKEEMFQFLVPTGILVKILYYCPAYRMLIRMIIK